jgi:hypothetical protein
LAAIYIMARSRYKWKAAWISGAIWRVVITEKWRCMAQRPAGVTVPSYVSSHLHVQSGDETFMLTVLARLTLRKTKNERSSVFTFVVQWYSMHWNEAEKIWQNASLATSS